MNLPIERSRVLSSIRNDIELSESENDPSIPARSDEPTSEVPGGSCGETMLMEEMPSGNADVLLVIATEIVDPTVDAPPALKSIFSRITPLVPASTPTVLGLVVGFSAVKTKLLPSTFVLVNRFGSHHYHIPFSITFDLGFHLILASCRRSSNQCPTKSLFHL
jgi:hypothetical protein